MTKERTNPLACPKAFDLQSSLSLWNSKAYLQSTGARPAPLSVLEFGSERGSSLLSAAGRLWKRVPFPCDVTFYPVERREGREGSYRHEHTGFSLLGRSLHIDHVFTWRYGPFTGQHTLSVFEEERLVALGQKGGMSLGGVNWSCGWPATYLGEGFVFRCSVSLYKDDERLFFKKDSRDFPFALYLPISVADADVEVIDLRGASESQFEGRVNLPDFEDLFHPSAGAEDRRRVLSLLLEKLKGHYYSHEALQRKISQELSHSSISKAFFEEGKNTFDSSDFAKTELIAKRIAAFLFGILGTEGEGR